MYLHLPILGSVLRLCAPIPVYAKPARWRFGERLRQAGRRESVVEACVAHLRRGKSIGLFPEGRRNPDPRALLRGRLGIGEVVLRTGSPVIPVGLHYPAARILGRAPHFGYLVLRVGAPLRFGGEHLAAQDASQADRQRLVRRELMDGLVPPQRPPLGVTPPPEKCYRIASGEGLRAPSDPLSAR
jgi:1-acyl-sn-glycerol-3-phosphate acyltransferase